MTFSAYLVPFLSSVNCIHFLSLILTSRNPANKIRLLAAHCQPFNWALSRFKVYCRVNDNFDIGIGRVNDNSDIG